MMKIAELCLTVLPILVRCLDFRDLSMDSVSGNLLQPAHWSDTSFNLAKQFRLRVSLTFSSPRLDLFPFRTWSILKLLVYREIPDCSLRRTDSSDISGDRREMLLSQG